MMVLLVPFTFAAMDPTTKECRQRGYETDVDRGVPIVYCKFPDGSRCRMEEFSEGTCGAEWKTENYGIKAGDYVWDQNCCFGNVPNTLGLLFIGQQRCIKIYQDPIFWLGSIIAVVIIILIIKKLKKKRTT